MKRQAKHHEAQGLFNAALSGDVCLLKEMKRVTTGKGQMDELTEELDGVTGEQEIVNKFKEVYKSLYNDSESKESMNVIKSKIEELSALSYLS